jgi:hypothetical protein
VTSRQFYGEESGLPLLKQAAIWDGEIVAPSPAAEARSLECLGLPKLWSCSDHEKKNQTILLADNSSNVDPS